MSNPPKVKLPPELQDQHGTADDFKNWNDELYEQAIVERLCVHYKVSSADRRAWCEENKVRAGFFGLSLTMWYEHFPAFPIRLGVRLIRHVARKNPMSHLFGEFGRTDLVAKYDELRDTLGVEAGGLVGMVFNWPRLAGVGNPTTGLILHNSMPDWSVPGVRLSWMPRDDRSEPLYLEHLQVFLRGLDAEGNTWMN